MARNPELGSPRAATRGPGRRSWTGHLNAPGRACIRLTMLTAVNPSLTDEAPETPADDDRSLIGAAARGEVPAFEALYRRHAGRVHGVIARLVGVHGARAEDLTQDAF